MRLVLLIPTFIALSAAAVNFEDWHPAGPNDARSPCPVLNALANHGILPRDGLNLTVPVVVQALADGVNVSSEISAPLAKLASTLSKNPQSGTFNLDDLNRHNAIEHDGSLSRQDDALGGDSHTFSPEIFNETLSYYGYASEIGIKEVAAARWGRIQSSKADNANFVYGEAQKFPSYFESSAYFQLLMNAATQKAPVSWIKILFREERLPFTEGWRPVNRIEGLSVAKFVLNIALNTPEKADGVNF